MKDYVAIIVVLIAALFVTPAISQSIAMMCYENPADLLDSLTDNYSERPMSVGTSNGAVVVMYANEITGTWTLTATLPSGTICQIASGKNYQTLEVELPANL